MQIHIFLSARVSVKAATEDPSRGARKSEMLVFLRLYSKAETEERGQKD